LPDVTIDQYINTFILYDFPEHLRLFNLRTTFTFYTDPYVDTYETSTNIASPLYDFKNKYITIHPPIYIAGFQALYLQSREQLYGMYPMTNSIMSIGTVGNGVLATYAGSVGTPTFGAPGSPRALILRNNVLFSSVAVNGNGLAMIDYPISPTIGNLYVPGGAPTSIIVQDPINYINYLTGQYVVTFVAAPGMSMPINSQIVQLAPSLPKTILFYDGKFTLRPVPDQAYRVNMEVYVRPTEMLAANQVPELSEWWQYIAYGAAKKVFEDRMDTDSVQMIMPEFKTQENLIQRRTIVQQTDQRVATIFTQSGGATGSFGPGWFSSGGTY
jgi:hypothetical protein